MSSRGRNPFLLLILAAFLVMNVVGTGLTLRACPQFSISREALLGENGRNLKEFELGERGELTSLSSDPWIYYAFGEPVNVRFLTVKVSGVGGAGSEARLYLIPSAGYRTMALTDGRLSARFGRAQGYRGVSAIRLDLATEPGAVLTVEGAVVNDRLAVILDFQKLYLSAWALGLLAVLEVLGWRRLFMLRQEERRGSSGRSGPAAMGFPRKWPPILAAAALQAILKAGILWTLRKPLMDNDGAGRQHLLCWMFVLGLEVFTIMSLHLGAGRKRKNIWYGLGLAVPFSFVWFSAAELLNLATFDFQTPLYLVLNLALCALVPAVFLLVLGNAALAFSGAALLFGVLSVANHYYGALRNNPLEYFDIANAGTAVHVLGNYSLALDGVSAAAVLALLVTVLTLVSALGTARCERRLRGFLGNVALAAAAAAVFAVKLPTFDNFSNLQIITREKGYLLSFASFIKMGRVKTPEGYTAKRAEEILETALDGAGIETGLLREAGDRYPNLIVIMNETLVDLPAIYGFETDTDVFPNIHSMDNAVRGKVLTSVYGGGTANTEYEFLTGNSLYFLPPGSSPYVQYMGSVQQSLAWKLKELGYQAAAYHPYLPISYRRSSVYPLLGLDAFYSEEDSLPHEEYLRTYVSDRADFKNVIHLYEEREPGRPFFMFNVTMQNHGGYSEDEPAVDVTVMPVDKELQTPQMLEYLSLIRESDAAFKELTDYFSEAEEDTVILMFGDHQPSMDEGVSEFMDRKLEERDGKLDSQRRYYASFILWANFDIQEMSDVVTSPGFLRPLLLEAAGVPLNAYESFLFETAAAYPAMNAFGCFDASGQWNSRMEDEEGVLEEYQYLVYQNVFDKKSMGEGYR